MAYFLIPPDCSLMLTVRPNLENYLYLGEHIYKDTYIASTGFAVISANQEINPKFLYYIITLQKTTDYLTLNAVGSSYPAVNNDVISNIDIPIPSPAIQSSIVQECEHIDGLIASLTKENERLEADNLIQTILATISNTTEPAAEIQETNDTVASASSSANAEPQEKTTKKLIKKKKEVSQKPIITVNAGSTEIEPIITEGES